jgi:hypothetical protein
VVEITPTSQWPSFQLDGERLVRPDFSGRGLANVAPTVLQLLAPQALREESVPPLSEAVLPAHLTEGVRNVVVLIADGLGHGQLRREIEAGNTPTMARLLERAANGRDSIAYAPITSVFPTTTVAALGSLNSAGTPAQTGLLGYTLYLAELGMVAEMIRWGPLNRRLSFTDPEFAQVPERFLWTDTVYNRLGEAGVGRAFAVNPSHFAGTALTRMLHQGASYCGYIATSSVTAIVARLLEHTHSEPTYVYAYWPTIDTIAHLLGPLTAEHSAEVAALDAALGRLLDLLPGQGDTLVLLTADHGHVDSGPDLQVGLGNHPQLLGMLNVPPAGERRAVYLHAQPRRRQAVIAYARERLTDVALVLTREEAVRLGLFGPAPLPERAAGRIGDVILLPRGNLQIVAPIESSTIGPYLPPPPVFRGLHGGLTPEEALVPLLAVRL